MSVVGIDFGNLSVLIGQAGKGGVDVILNGASNRQTATCVSIQGKQRFIGDAGAAMARSNITNTISCMKLLIGRKFDCPDVQRELTKAPFKAAKLSNGGVGIVVSYNDGSIVVPAEQFMAMMLVHAKETAQKANNGANVADAVLAVPFWYTDAQRRAILSSSEIASLNCLKVSNESTLIALSYGIFKSAKKLFSETDPVHIMFIDIGYTGMSVTVVDFIQENMRVLATVCDREIGGRDFDDVIIEFLAETFQKKTGIDVRGNIKAILKLQVAAEKAKKTLSPAGVSEANVSVECLADEKDLNALLTKDEFEARSARLVARLEEPINRCLSEAGLRREDVAEVEILGGTSRVNVVKRRLGEILGLDPSALNYGLKTTMNADEAVARGGALQCAMSSSRMKVKPFNIVDRLPYGIVAHYDTVASSASAAGDAEDTKEDVAVGGSSAAIYTRGDEIPHKPRRLTFRKKTADFTITLTYDDHAVATLPPGEDRVVGKYQIKIPPGSNNDVRVTFNIDKHGCVYIQSAQLMEEIPDEPAAPAEGKEAPAGEEAKEEGPAKKRFRKKDLDVVAEVFGLSRDDVKAALELEASMAFEDRQIVETADRRNDLESYIYAMRSKIDGALKEYGSGAEKSSLQSALTEAEDWLYGDGFESTKQEYIRKLDELKRLGDPLEARAYDDANRPGAIDALKKQIELCRSFVANQDEAHSHINDEERDKIREALRSAESWMFDLQDKQRDVPRHQDSVLSVEAIGKKRNELFSVSNPIMTKPKPKPAPAPAPAPTPAPAPSPADDSKQSEAKAEGEEAPMDT